MGRLDGKVCVITGAAGGIGAETARLFGEEGATVVGADLDDGSVGDLTLRVDVTDPAQVEEMYARAKREFGRIDVLFNNAGISPTDDASVLETELDVWQRVQDVNLKSIYLCCKLGIPLPARERRRLGDQHRLVRRGHGRRYLADLLHGLEGRRAGALARARASSSPARACASTRSVPGPVNTPLLQELYAHDQEAAARRLVHLPMGRFAEAREIAYGALFLASDESSYVTAQTFLVDGGLSGAYVTPE